MKALTIKKREKLSTKLLYEFSEGQSANEYYFNIDNVRLVWLQESEIWIALWEKPYGEIQPWVAYLPKTLYQFIDELTDEQLVKYCDDFFV